MSRPESFVRATLGELSEWYVYNGTDIFETLAALRDAVVAEKDAEWDDKHRELVRIVTTVTTRAERAEAEVADAQRAGGYAALTKLCNSLNEKWNGKSSTAEHIAAFRDRHYAPPEPMPLNASRGYVDVMVEESSNGPFVRIKSEHIAALVALAQEGK